VDVTDPKADEYIRSLLARHDEPVLLEMEAEAAERGFPIVDRTVGVVLEVMARAIGARRVFELGSGFGYSGYWFARAVGPDGELHLTDGDPANEPKALDYLGRAGLAGPVRFHVGDALEALADTDGPFDVVFCDIDKLAYPDAWEAARGRIRVGGLYICDNTLKTGSSNAVTGEDGGRSGVAEAIRRHNEAIAADEGFVSVILPVRDGDLVALRLV
jgi:predicted O-methyltransferase YrrM